MVTVLHEQTGGIFLPQKQGAFAFPSDCKIKWNKHGVTMKTSTWKAQLTVASSKAQHYLNSLCITPKRPPSTSKFYVDFKTIFFKEQKIETHLLFLDVCVLSGISWSWKILVFGRFTSQERRNVHRTAFFLQTPDFSLSKVTALKVVWGKDTSRRSKEPGSDRPSCFSAWAPFCKFG